MQFDLSDRETIFSSLPPGGIGAEIGVDFGEFSKVIRRNAKPRLFYLVDVWIEQSMAVCGHDPANYRQEIKDAAYRQVLGWFMTDEGMKVVKEFSEIAAPMFPDAYFDWAFIDANHLRCYEDIQSWWPKVKSGGWLMGHDYCTVGDYITVKKSVDRFVAETGLPLLTTDDEIYKCWIIQKP